VFIKYNQNLKNRFKRKDLIDPISLDDIDASNEWMTGHMVEGDNSDVEVKDELVFEGDTLTWGDVTRASGAGERLHMTRQHATAKSKGKGKEKASTSTMQPNFVEIEEEATFEDDSHDDNFEYDSKEEEDYGDGSEDGSGDDDDDNWN